MARTKYNYKKINNRIVEINNKRNDKGFFIGTTEELDELMQLDAYNREDIAHALCLDFKTNVIKENVRFRVNGKGYHVGERIIYLEVDKHPYYFKMGERVEEETEELEKRKKTCWDYFYYGYLKDAYNEKPDRVFLLHNKDISCCECWFIEEELTA